MKAACGRVLVAEDNFVLSRVIQFNLEQAGYGVTLAANGHEAIELLSTEPFDLMITDYQMPITDGAEVCDYVRHTLNDAKLPIILCSAKGLELEASSLQDRWQLAAVLFKPFSVREMLAHIRRLLVPSLPVEVSSAAE